MKKITVFHCKLCNAAHPSTSKIIGLDVDAVPDSLITDRGTGQSVPKDHNYLRCEVPCQK